MCTLNTYVFICLSVKIYNFWIRSTSRNGNKIQKTFECFKRSTVKFLIQANFGPHKAPLQAFIAVNNIQTSISQLILLWIMTGQIKGFSSPSHNIFSDPIASYRLLFPQSHPYYYIKKQALEALVYGNKAISSLMTCKKTTWGLAKQSHPVRLTARQG